MTPIRILIADDNESFRTNLQTSLSCRFLVKTCENGKDALREILSFRPNILIVDLLLQELDGLSLLCEVSQLPEPPTVLVTTTFSNDYVQEKLYELGVGSLIMKPCDLKATVTHVLQMASQYTPPISPKTGIAVGRLLQNLNIPTHMDGCAQLKIAIPIYARDPSKPLNKVIYSEVAKKCGNDNPKQVERSIRNVIDKAWSCRTGTKWNEYFPDGKPTNKVFISRLASQLLIMLSDETEPAV